MDKGPLRGLLDIVDSMSPLVTAPFEDHAQRARQRCTRLDSLSKIRNALKSEDVEVVKRAIEVAETHSPASLVSLRQTLERLESEQQVENKKSKHSQH